MEIILQYYLNELIAVAIAFVVCFVTIPVVIEVSRQNNLLDKPDYRKQHKAPIPTMGGIGVVAGVLASAFVWMKLLSLVESCCISFSIVMLLTTGVLDDLKGLSALKRLLVQLFAGVLAVYAGFVVHIPEGLFGLTNMPLYMDYVFTVFLIAGVTNSFNLIDGIDGLAGGIGLINSVCFGIFFLYLGYIPFAILSFSLGAALLAFLFYNFSPAMIFMGDTGSLVLGYLMVLFAIKVMNLSAMTTDANTFLLLVFALLLIPVIDTLRVFLFRALKSKSPFSADRSHIHHLLLKTGLNHRKASLILYAANILMIITAFLLRSMNTEFALFLLVLTAIVLIEILSIKRLFRIRTRVKHLYEDYKEMSRDNQLLMKYLKEKNDL